MRRRTAARHLDSVRSAYDQSLTDSGVVLVQQTAAGADNHHMSRSVLDLLGWDPAAFLTPGTLRAIVHVEDLPEFRTAASDPSSEAAVVRLRHADGTYHSFRFGVKDSGPDRPLTFTLVDVSNDTTARSRRRRAEELLDKSHDALLILTLEDQAHLASVSVIDLNGSAAELIRRQSVGLLDEIFGDVSLNLIRNSAFDVAHTGESIEFGRLQMAEFPGRLLDAELSRLSDGSVALRLSDVTQQAELEEHLRHRALHDQRTGLANLAMLEDRLVELAHGEAATIGMLAVDMRTTDTDDQMIREVARRLEGTMTPGALIARVGECRLAVLPPPLSHADELGGLAQTAAAALAIAFDVDGDAVAVDAVVGGSAAATSDAPQRLLRDAESAARRAAAEDRTWALHSEGGRQLPSGLFHQVRDSIGSGDMELRYQPIIDLRTGRVAKVEALLRWGGSADNSLSALELASQSGVVDSLPRWVIGEAATAANALSGLHDGLKVAINLSAFGNGEDLDGFIRLLHADGIDVTGRLEVEVAETALTDSPLRGAELVERLRSIGLAVVIDDFGAGYTSLSTVSDLAVDGLKIDRSYIATLTSIPADATVVQSTIEFCHQLGIEVTALGVADEPTLSALRSMRCDLAQGFLLSEPVPLDDVSRRVAELEHAFV
ncbi:MAG: EAL domain-containing protein [Actinomycetia bacterium]|nr:EAL domain-containing protein [Actinomycetes bacterium]